jgi:hypothetical protein
MKITEVYNYMYYRLAKWYFRHEEKEKKLSTGAAGIVSLSQIVIIIDVVGVIFLKSYDRIHRDLIMNKYYFIFVSLVLLIYLLNGFKYWNKFKEYDQKWGNEIKKDRNIGRLIIIALIIFPLVFTPIYLNLF